MGDPTVSELLFDLGVQWTNSWMARSTLVLFGLLIILTALYSVAETVRMVAPERIRETICSAIFTTWVVVLELVMAFMAVTWFLDLAAGM